MITFTDDQYAILFKFAAIYNFIASAAFLLLPGISTKLLFRGNVVADFYAHTFYNFVWAFVLIFGIGYYIISRDVNKNLGIALLGILGKLFFYVYFVYMFFASKCTIFGILGVSGDLLFSMAFGYFIYQKKTISDI